MQNRKADSKEQTNSKKAKRLANSKRQNKNQYFPTSL